MADKITDKVTVYVPTTTTKTNATTTADQGTSSTTKQINLDPKNQIPAGDMLNLLDTNSAYNKIDINVNPTKTAYDVASANYSKAIADFSKTYPGYTYTDIKNAVITGSGCKIWKNVNGKQQFIVLGREQYLKMEATASTIRSLEIDLDKKRQLLKLAEANNNDKMQISDRKAQIQQQVDENIQKYFMYRA
ncbi:MAG: hypothetical protein WCK67_12800 [bacterium]